MTAATATAIQYLNLAYFGRPADPASLSAWPATGQTLEQIVLAFVGTAEYSTNTIEPNSAAAPGGGRTFNDTNLIQTFYNRLFGRNASSTEVSGWANALASGAVNYDYLGITILQAGLNLPASSEMRKVLLAKFDSNQLYTGILYNDATAASAYSTAAAIKDGIAFSASNTTTTPATSAQAQTSVAQMVADSGASGGQSFTLTTAADTATAATFNGQVAINSGVVLNTLNNADRLTGSGSNATLNATLLQNNGGAYTVTPALLANIKAVKASFATVGAGGAGAVTLDLGNATGVTTVTLSDSSQNNIVQNIQSVLANIGITNTASNQTFNFAANVLDGTTDSVTLNLSAVTAGTVTIGAGYETISIVSGGNAANTIAALAGSTPATLNISGSRGLTITGSLAAATTAINAAAAAGNVAVTHTNAAVVTFTGGAGDDTITLGATYVGGADGTANRDTINGGAGSNTLSITSAVASVAVNQANVTNIQTISISDAVANNIDLTRFASATGLTQATAGVAVGANTFTFNSGSTITINSTTAGNSARSYVVGGTAINDTLTLTKAAAATNLGNAAQTFTGIEVLNINTNATAGAALTFGGALTMAPTAGGTSSIAVSGANNLVLTGAVTAGNVDASKLTGTGSLQMGLAAGGLAGAGRIVGSAQGDQLVGSAAADIIQSGAGNDTVQAGAGIDTIDLGDGLDVVRISAAAANGADRDLITGFTAGNGATADVFNFNQGIVALTGTDNFATAAALQAVAVAGNLQVAAAANVVQINTATIANATDANSLNGTNLLAALGGTITGAVNGPNDILLTVGITGGGTAVYYADSADNAIIAAEMTLIGVLNGVTNSSLLFSNFANAV